MEEQRSEEWFAKRVGRITGSRVGAVLGMNPWQSPDDLLRDMVREYHGVPSEFEDNPAVQWGRAMEDGAVSEFEMETGLTVEPCGFYPFEDWLGASPDGMIQGENDTFEAKCPYGLRNADQPAFKSAEDQPHYFAQMQIEMLCSGVEWCHFYQWAPGGSRHEIVPRDARWLEWALPILKDFHARYLSELDNPAHMEPKRPEVNTLTAEHLLSEYDDLKEAEERAKERKQEVLAELVRLAGERNALVCGRNLTRVERAGSVQYARVVKEHLPGLDLEPYKGKSSVFWRLT